MMLTLVTGLHKEDSRIPRIKKLKDEPIDLKGDRTEKFRRRKKERVGNTQLMRSRSSEGTTGLMDPEIERDILLIIKKYFKREAVFDILANFPIMFYHIFNEWPKNEAEIGMMAESTVFNICMGLKTLRLAHIYEVSESLKRLMENLTDIFYM